MPRRAVPAFVSAGAHAGDDDHVLRLGQRLGPIVERGEVAAQPLGLVGQIDLGADGIDLGAALDRLADARVDQRRFPARVGAHEQDRLGVLDARDGRVEAVGCRVGDVEHRSIDARFM